MRELLKNRRLIADASCPRVSVDQSLEGERSEVALRSRGLTDAGQTGGAGGLAMDDECANAVSHRQ